MRRRSHAVALGSLLAAPAPPGLRKAPRAPFPDRGKASDSGRAAREDTSGALGVPWCPAGRHVHGPRRRGAPRAQEGMRTRRSLPRRRAGSRGPHPDQPSGAPSTRRNSVDPGGDGKEEQRGLGLGPHPWSLQPGPRAPLWPSLASLLGKLSLQPWECEPASSLPPGVVKFSLLTAGLSLLHSRSGFFLI